MSRSSLLRFFVSAACLTAGASGAKEPIALEAFAASPGVAVEFSQAVGAIESSDVRPDQLHLDESLLPALQEDLAGIESGIPELEDGGAPYRVEGTSSCWMPVHPQRILCPGYRAGPDWSGLMLAAWGSGGFEFPAHRPAELAALIEHAIRALAAP